MFLLDIGLLGAMMDLDARTVLEGNAVFTDFKGALAEQFACRSSWVESRQLAGWNRANLPVENVPTCWVGP